MSQFYLRSYILCIYSYIHAFDIYVLFLFFFFNDFSLVVYPRSLAVAPCAPRRRLLLAHPEYKSLHLPPAGSRGVSLCPPCPSAASSLICVGLRLVLMLRLRPVAGTSRLRKASLLVLSPGVNASMTTSLVSLGKELGVDSGADASTRWIRKSEGAQAVADRRAPCLTACWRERIRVNSVPVIQKHNV